MPVIAGVQIREMFDAVAPGYDRSNQMLSWGTHHWWRRQAVRRSGARTGDSVLDCATGTGDLAFAFERTVGSSGTILGVDFSRPMIELAAAKGARRKSRTAFLVGDVLKLPFADGRFDIASIAFGIRNVDDPASGLREMARVVRRGGRVVVLEFSRPEGALFGRLYRWYGRSIIPRVGGWITGQPSSYRYLVESAATFPSGADFVSLMQQTGAFARVDAMPLMGQVASIYVGTVLGTV